MSVSLVPVKIVAQPPSTTGAIRSGNQAREAIGRFVEFAAFCERAGRAVPAAS